MLLDIVAVAVGIPAVAIDAVVMHGHEPHARFDQTPSHQARLAKQVTAIAVAQLRRFAADVDRLAGLARGHQRKRPLAKSVEAGGMLRVVEPAAPGIELSEQRLPLPLAVERDPFAGRHARWLEGQLFVGAVSPIRVVGR